MIVYEVFLFCFVQILRLRSILATGKQVLHFSEDGSEMIFILFSFLLRPKKKQKKAARKNYSLFRPARAG